MANVFLAGLDITSRQWLLHESESDGDVNFDGLEKAIALRHTEVERDEPKGLLPDAPKQGQGCAANPLMIAEREVENYVLGKAFMHEPLGPVLGVGRAIEQRFRLNLTATAPELILSSKYDNGYLMFRKIILNLSDGLNQGAQAIFVHETNVNKPIFSVVVETSESRPLCKCVQFPCTCGRHFRTMQDLANFYQVLRHSSIKSPWTVFGEFMKQMPTIKMRKEIQAFRMDTLEPVPMCHRLVYSHLEVVRSALDIDNLKFAYVQECIEKIALPSAGLSLALEGPDGPEDDADKFDLGFDFENEDVTGLFDELTQTVPTLEPVVGASMAIEPATFSTMSGGCTSCSSCDIKQSNTELPLEEDVEEDVAVSVAEAAKAAAKLISSSDLDGDYSPAVEDNQVIPVNPVHQVNPVNPVDPLIQVGEPLHTSSDEEHGGDLDDVYHVSSPVNDEHDHHDNEGKPTCPHCHATFKRKYEMQRHVKSIHLKEKRHTCNICGKGFFQRSHLTVHQRTVHERRKDDVCMLCGRTFATKYKVDRHIRAVHNRERTYKCDICGSDYYQSSDLKRHCRLQHPEMEHTVPAVAEAL